VKAPSLPERPARRKAAPKARTVDADADAARGSDKGDDSEKAKVVEKKDEPDEFESPPAAARPFFELGVGGRVFSRNMTYADNYSGLPGYKLARANALTMDMIFYPFALAASSADSWAGGLGLTGAFSYAMGIGTQGGGSAGASRTEVFGYELGVRKRFIVGMVDIIPHLGYLVDQFMATNAERSPDVRYQVVRVGLGGQLNFGTKAALRASFDYLDVLNPGPMGDMFPRATVRGVDFTVGAGYAFTDTLEGTVSGGWKRYGFDMRAQPGDDLIAGGAVDEYLSMTIGFAYRPTVGRR
jgi:hypothetical protein